VGDAGKKGFLDTFFKFEILYSLLEVMVAYSYLLWPPEGGHMAHVENH